MIEKTQEWSMVPKVQLRDWMRVSLLTEEGSTLRRSDLGDKINNESRLLNIVINYESLYGGDIDQRKQSETLT